MAINDRSITAAQKQLVRKYGIDVLSLSLQQQEEALAEGVIATVDEVDPEIDAGLAVLDYLKVLSQYAAFQKKVKKPRITSRKARALKTIDAEAYVKLYKGSAIFTAASDLKSSQGEAQSVVAQTYANLSASVKLELDHKMLEANLIKEIKRNDSDMTYYIQAKEGRDVAMRSLQAQGFRINKTDLRSNPNAAGTRGKFNVFNNNQSSFYATGSWKSGTGLNNSGPRIQGPAGGSGSCKFVIIHRSGSVSGG
tara:strand:+ start:190 stop:945 length:756 start_codon:yes stop_codon:yes gene_type:complete